MNIEGTENTPKVVLSVEDRYILLEGESRPEDVRLFYAPILDWIKTDLKSTLSNGTELQITAEFKLEYFNSASSKYILDILEELKELQVEYGTTLSINWFYEEPDEDMKEAGEEFSMLTEINFNFETITY